MLESQLTLSRLLVGRKDLKWYGQRVDECKGHVDELKS